MSEGQKGLLDDKKPKKAKTRKGKFKKHGQTKN